MKTLGICIGASSVSIVGLENDSNDNIRELASNVVMHNGDSKGVLKEELQKIDINSFDRICLTGRKFRKFVNLTSITEPEAVENSIKSLIKDRAKYNAL